MNPEFYGCNCKDLLRVCMNAFMYVHHPVCLVPMEIRCWIPWNWSSRWLWAMGSAVLLGGIITRAPRLRLSWLQVLSPFQESILSAHSSCSNVLGIYRDLTQESSRLEEHSSWYLVSSWWIPQGHDEEIKMDEQEKLLGLKHNLHSTKLGSWQGS